MNPDASLVFDVAELAKAIHKEADARTRRHEPSLFKAEQCTYDLDDLRLRNVIETSSHLINILSCDFYESGVAQGISADFYVRLVELRGFRRKKGACPWHLEEW